MLLLAITFGLLTLMANLAGSALAVFKVGSGRRTTGYIGFGGGFLLAAALFEILPHSLEGGITMPFYVVLGYVVVYISEQIFASHAHEEPHSGFLAPHTNEEIAAGHTLVQEFRHPAAAISVHAGLAAFVGFNVHDLIDGLAIGSAMLTSQSVGLLVFLAVLLHEAPAGFTISAIMLAAGRSRRAAFLAGLSIGLVTIIGILIPFLIAGMDILGDGVSHIFLALSAGSFIYIAATDLIPAATGGKKRFTFLYVIAGMFVFLATSELVGLLLN